MAQERDKAKRQKELFLSKLEEMPVVSVLCQKLKIPKSNIYRWIEVDSEFKKRFEEIKKRGDETINDLALSVIIQNMKNGNLGAAKFWLSNKHQDFIKDKFRYEKANPIEPFQMMITTVDNQGRPVNRKKLAEKINKSKTKKIKLKRMDIT
jgi:hypothetical protein